MKDEPAYYQDYLNAFLGKYLELLKKHQDNPVDESDIDKYCQNVAEFIIELTKRIGEQTATAFLVSLSTYLPEILCKHIDRLRIGIKEEKEFDSLDVRSQIKKLEERKPLTFPSSWTK